MKFRTAFTSPEVKASAPGEPIYKWSYVNDDGEEVVEEMNVYERIQSSAGLADYKRVIAAVGIEEAGYATTDQDVYGDVTPYEYGSNGGDFSSRLQTVVQMLRQAEELALGKNEPGKGSDQSGAGSAAPTGKGKEEGGK